MRDVVAGLTFLAGRDILHQDIKPANILFSKGKFKLADFGITINMRTSPLATQPVGTLVYIAP